MILFIQVLYLQLQIPIAPTVIGSSATTTTGNEQPAGPATVATDEKKPGTDVSEVGVKGEGKKYDLRKRK